MNRRDFLKFAFGALGAAVAVSAVQPMMAAIQPVASETLWGMPFKLDPHCPPNVMYFVDTRSGKRVGEIRNISIKGSTITGDISGGTGNGLTL